MQTTDYQHHALQSYTPVKGDTIDIDGSQWQFNGTEWHSPDTPDELGWPVFAYDFNWIRRRVNPILAAYDEDSDDWKVIDGDWINLDTPQERWQEYVEKELIGFDYTPEDLDEARRVLAGWLPPRV